MIRQEHDILEYLTEKINDKRHSLEEYLGGGKAVSFDEYKFIAGQLKGLEHSLGYVNEVVLKIDKQEGE